MDSYSKSIPNANARFSRHNLESSSFSKGIYNKNSVTTFPESNSKIYIATMRMKNPRIDNVLLGFDHGVKKRQRTMSEASESSAIENDNKSSNNADRSPRMMALLSSLEALDDKGPQQPIQPAIQQQWPLNPAKTAPLPASHYNHSIKATLSAQREYKNPPTIGQPLNARPSIHRIEERLPTQSAPQITVQAERREATANASALDILQRTVVAAQEELRNVNSNNSFKRALEQQGIAKNSIANGSVPQYSSPTFAAPTTSMANSRVYSHLPNHASSTLPHAPPTARQMAIHNAIHSDYERVFKPLKRPPRLPTFHETLMLTALSTVAQATTDSAQRHSQ